ncbi:hypothetical protein Cgig2_024350 [Carnegiea gigantea]|uniref:Pectinesterase inhibitor domain-containing protein n=1 Tax=Carnegiea gigantea TaxID=171969 RepID=A0A9Q1K2R3_9CARY|nr:hypothetical protein Cgig2_024350 [Carnegiea gigantea]
MELALGNATNTVQIISKMLDKNTSDPHCQSCVESCLELYSAMSAILEDSISEFLSKQYDPVYMSVSTIMQATNICEESFTVEGEESPLTKENHSLTQLCGIVLCIIDLMSPVLDSQSSRAVFPRALRQKADYVGPQGLRYWGRELNTYGALCLTGSAFNPFIDMSNAPGL